MIARLCAWWRRRRRLVDWTPPLVGEAGPEVFVPNEAGHVGRWLDDGFGDGPRCVP